MPTRRMLTEMQSIIDELYPSTFMLQKAKKRDEDIGTLVTLATRVKIYHGCYDLIKMYKKDGTVNQETLQRTLNRIKLHRYQLKKMTMNKMSYADNHKYLIGLAALLHVSFTN
jgi:hypothetical protein